MCTGIRLISKNGAVVYARTLEFAQDINSSIIFIPRGLSFTGTTPQKNRPGLQWKSRYAALGANAAGELGIIDGVNQVGLAGGLFYLPDYAEYQEVPDNKFDQTIAPWQLITWILTSCGSIDEVKKNLPTITVANVIFDQWGIIPPIHAIVHDPQGNSLVIEYIKGQLQLHDNHLGVITNAPNFEWHITNLKNYLNMSPHNAQPLTLDAIKLTPLGQGSGMLGLPGDFTPPSRFVRAVFYSANVLEIKNAQESCFTAFHLLDLFDIPLGVVIEDSEDDSQKYECTQWTSVVDLQNKRYHFHTYRNRVMRMVDLMEFDGESEQAIVVMKM